MRGQTAKATLLVLISAVLGAACQIPYDPDAMQESDGTITPGENLGGCES